MLTLFVCSLRTRQEKQREQRASAELFCGNNERNLKPLLLPWRLRELRSSERTHATPDCLRSDLRGSAACLRRSTRRVSSSQGVIPQSHRRLNSSCVHRRPGLLSHASRNSYPRTVKWHDTVELLSRYTRSAQRLLPLESHLPSPSQPYLRPRVHLCVLLDHERRIERRRDPLEVGDEERLDVKVVEGGSEEGEVFGVLREVVAVPGSPLLCLESRISDLLRKNSTDAYLLPHLVRLRDSRSSNSLKNLRRQRDQPLRRDLHGRELTLRASGTSQGRPPASESARATAAPPSIACEPPWKLKGMRLCTASPIKHIFSNIRTLASFAAEDHG